MAGLFINFTSGKYITKKVRKGIRVTGLNLKMADRKKGIMHLIGKKYTYEMLRSLEKGSKRFKAMHDVCKIEKMRVQRLRELESLELIKVRAKRIGRRAVSIYSLSEKGKKALKLAENIKKLETEKSKQS